MSMPENTFWIDWFCNYSKHKYFCKIDLAFIKQTAPMFQSQILYYPLVVKVVTGCHRNHNEGVNIQAKKLYGLIHARFILTPAGLSQMKDKFEKYVFAHCPRYCGGLKSLPMAISDEFGVDTVRLLCAKCLFVFKVPHRYDSLDGAYFGQYFPDMFFDRYPELVNEEYEPMMPI